jgi:hypothetical protein
MADQALIAERMLNALKGISGTGGLLGKASAVFDKLMLEPGDYALSSGGEKTKMTAPIGHDLWYLHNAVNLVHHIDPATDSEVYVDENLSFLEDKLNGLKPLKAMTIETLKNYAKETSALAGPPTAPAGWQPDRGMPDQPLPDPNMSLDQLHAYVQAVLAWGRACKEIQDRETTEFREFQDNWANEGAYFIQVMAYELGQKGTPFGQYDQDDYCGCLMFPVGQLGVMEVVSLFQETELEVNDFELTDDETPIIISNPEMFPPMEHAGEGWSFGKYLVERGYLVPDDVKAQVELMSTVTITETDYTQDVKPKSWTKWWIKKTDTLPVPGEFVGILVKPLSVPPHVWWFQETTPLLYAGNWVETQNLTSGVITQVTLEADRTDGGVGDEYWVKINGIEIIAYASDFKLYEVDDRVAILKRWTTSAKATRSFTWKDQRDGQHPIKDQVSLEFVIMPITFYKQT